MEFVIVKNDILRCVYHDESFDLDHYLYRILFVIFLRNASFYLFFTVLKLYQQTKAIALIEKKEALKHDGLVLLMPLRGAPVSINIKYVCYFSHEKNLTFIHNTFGKVTSVYSTLKNILEYLGDYCLQINKENIITYTNIIRYNNDTVTIKEGKGNKQKLLTYYKKDVPNILNKLREKVPDLEEKNTKFSHQNHFDGVNDDKRHKSGGLKNEILEEITNNPGISVVIIAQKMKEKASLRTIERKLKELKKSEHIVYRGSDKTGGYYLV
jgi:hypothetical protein